MSKIYVYILIQLLSHANAYASSCLETNFAAARNRQITNTNLKIHALRNLVAQPGSIADRYPAIVANLLALPLSKINGQRYLYDELLVNNPNMKVKEAVAELLTFGKAYTKLIKDIISKELDQKTLNALMRSHNLESSFISRIRYFHKIYGPNPTPFNTVLSPKVTNEVILNNNRAKAILTNFAIGNVGFWAELVMALHVPNVITHSVRASELNRFLNISSFPLKLEELKAQDKALRDVEFDLFADHWQSTSVGQDGLAIIEIKSYMHKMYPRRDLRDQKRLDKWIFKIHRQLKIINHLGIKAQPVLWTLGDIGQEARNYLTARVPGLEIITQ